MGLVPPIRTTKPKCPVRVHSATPFGGDAPLGPAALATAVANFHKYQKSQNPSFPIARAAYIPAPDIGIGHEASQLVAKLLLADSGLPSCGFPVNVWMNGPDMFAELDAVPEAVARLCNAHCFSEVSAEIYPNYRTPDGKHHGPVLKRISLIGAATPRQKGLGKLPPFVYSDTSPAKGKPWNGQQVVAYFSEGPFNMDRTQALAVLQAAGIPVDGLDSTPDAFVIAVAQMIQGATPPASPPAASQDLQTFADRVIGPMLRTALEPVHTAIAEVRQQNAATTARTVEQELLTFADAEKAKLLPSERDPKNPLYIVTRLSRMPADIRTAEMDAVRQRPALTFADRMPQGGTVQPTAGGTGPMTPERRAQLLSHTPTGRAKLEREQREQRQGRIAS
jgi:hypothetical protein